MTPYFAFALVILFILCVLLGGFWVALLHADMLEPAAAPLFAAAITPEANTPQAGLSRLQTTQFVDMDVIQLQGIFTALLQDEHSTNDNPYPLGSQARAVWFGGYAMAQARANQQATPQHAGDRA